MDADLKRTLGWTLDYLDVIYDQLERTDLVLPVMKQALKTQAEQITAWLADLHLRYEGVPECVKQRRR